MKNTRHEEIELIDLIIKPFKNKQKRIRILIAVILFLNMVLSFFSVTNWMEALVGVLCIISLFLLGRIKGKVGDLLCCSWALVMVANLFVTPFLGTPFFGLFSDESLQKRAEERFYNKFAEALYELSVYECRQQKKIDC